MQNPPIPNELLCTARGSDPNVVLDWEAREMYAYRCLIPRHKISFQSHVVIIERTSLITSRHIPYVCNASHCSSKQPISRLISAAAGRQLGRRSDRHRELELGICNYATANSVYSIVAAMIHIRALGACKRSHFHMSLSNRVHHHFEELQVLQ